jgi:hypothetical protein
MARQIAWRRTDGELNREEPARDDALVGARADTEAHIDPVEHPVAFAVVQLDLGVYGGIAPTELVEHRREAGFKRTQRP